MSMESECSVTESVEDNETIGSNGNLDNSGESLSKVESINRSSAVENDKQFVGDVNKGEAVGVIEPVISSPAVVAEGSGSGSPSSSTKKGHGLRKWRRIKREVSKDLVVSVDSSKQLKRGLSTAVVHPGKAMQFSAEMKQKSEGSVSSTNAVVDGFGIAGDLGLAMGPLFAAGTDRENSEDRNSKSSTGASVQRMRYEGHVVRGHVGDKNKMKSLSEKNLGSSVQRLHQVKVHSETSKKSRGEHFKIEKENSHSSMESDSRSSNFVFVQGPNSLTSNGRPNARSLIYDGENSDEAQHSERLAGQELHTGYGRRNDLDFEDVSQADLADISSREVGDENNDNQRCTTDQDHMSESIHLLGSAQVALEKELQEYREIGKEDILSDDSGQNSSIPLEFTSVGLVDHGSESDITSLKEDINVLKSKLDKNTAMLKVKESRIAELEAVSSSQSLQESGSGRELNMENDRFIECDLETLFRLKIEAEVEYLALSRMSPDLISILEEQKKLASHQSQMLNELGFTESKAAMLKKEAEQLVCEDIVSVDETLKLQNSVYKYASCFSIQLILLAVILGLVLRLSSQSGGAVPT